MPGKILVITGPTATGKTELGVRLALETGGEVVSADSMQIYKGMDIGTAKPTHGEMRGVTHHMLDIVDPRESYSAARYVEDAGRCTEDILARGKLPIIVGGTGLYIDSLVSGRNFAAISESSGAKQRLEEEFERRGGVFMLGRLAKIDPAAAIKLHPADRKRIVRALEVFEETGKTITQHNEETKLLPPRYDALKIVLSFKDRGKLYERIERRVDMMRTAGLTQEVRELLIAGIPENSTAMQAIGYKELAASIAGECSEDEAYDRIKQESRRYAKRQLTWLRRDAEARWILWKENPDFDFAVHASTEYLGKFGYTLAEST